MRRRRTERLDRRSHLVRLPGRPLGRPVWPDFRQEPGRLLEFTNDGPVAKPVPFADRLDLIEAYYARVR